MIAYAAAEAGFDHIVHPYKGTLFNDPYTHNLSRSVVITVPL